MNSADCLLGKCNVSGSWLRRALLSYIYCISKQCPNEAYSDSLSANWSAVVMCVSDENTICSLNVRTDCRYYDRRNRWDVPKRLRRFPRGTGLCLPNGQA